MLYNKIDNPVLNDEVSKSFENITFFDLGEINYGGKIIISFVRFNDLSDLKSEWKDFNNYITAKFISNITDEYSKWNFYIFYISSQNVSKALKYEIENNKFSSRKIIVEIPEPDIDPEKLSNIISEHIVNDNIEFTVENIQIASFNKSAIISGALKLASVNKLKEVKEENLLVVLKNLETSLRHEN